MRSLTDQVVGYAACHRDRRNIATHFVGVPLIVLAVAVLLSRPAFDLAGLSLSPAWLAVAAAGVFYLALSLPYGLAMTALLALAAWAAGWIAAGSTASWLLTGVGLFVVGWAIQFLGHFYEGRRPAFVDDLAGLLVGPLFLVLEIAFALGFSGALKREVETRVGPIRDGKPRKPAACEP